MKLNLHIILTVLSGFSLAGLPAGCQIPTKEDIATSTTEFNLVAEKAGNEMLLLNIVRASKRRPMYFTSIGKLTGNKTFEYGTGSINIPFGSIGGALDSDKSIAPSAGYKNSPLFDVTVLNTKEFTNGVMTPVSMTRLGYYMSLGWPSEILLNLFIRRIDIRDTKNPDAQPEIYLNYPVNQKHLAIFQRQIRNHKWEIIKVDDVTTIGEVDPNETSKLQNLIEVQKAGLKLRQGKEKNKMELCSSQTKYVLLMSDKNGKTVLIDEKDVFLRSPHAMLYYLGEIMRVANRTENPYMPMIDVSHDRSVELPARLFYARTATDEDITPCVSVDYEGTRYVIPGDSDPVEGYCTDRSMQVLSLVSQLIGLQKTSEEAPATGVVSVIGR